jgi:hypothetical protein
MTAARAILILALVGSLPVLWTCARRAETETPMVVPSPTQAA